MTDLEMMQRAKTYMDKLANGINPDKILMFKDEISDPFGGSLETYLFCAEQLKNNIKLTIGELND